MGWGEGGWGEGVFGGGPQLVVDLDDGTKRPLSLRHFCQNQNGPYSSSSPSVLPVNRLTRCTWLQARHVTGS
jgi:hypothetical protein